MRLLIIDHNAVRSCDRTLYRAIQAAGIKDLVLVAPAHWKEFGLSFACEEENGPLKVIPCRFSFLENTIEYCTGILQKSSGARCRT